MKRLLPATLLALVLGACASAPKAKPPAWPAPPATERIRFVETITGGSDLEGGMSKLWRNVAGVEAQGRMYHPVGVAVTPEGDLVAVTDQGINLLFIFDRKSKKTAQVPEQVLGGSPVGVAMEGTDTVWTVVPTKRRLLAFGRDGSPKRTLELPDVERPTGIAIHAEQKLVYIADTSSTEGKGHSVHVHDLATGEHKTTIGKKGAGPGELFFPTFVGLSPRGVYVADTMNARVMEFAPDGTFLRQIGERGDQFGQFDKPKGIATDSFGNIYVVDSFYSAVQIFSPDGKLLLFFGGRGDSVGFLSNPSGIAIDSKNRIYVTNGLNFRIEVYELVNTTAADSQVQDGSRS